MIEQGPDLRNLFATAPAEFVAARNALVKKLKAAKRRGDANAVGKLRRPGWPDWALNAVAREAPALVSEFAAAADELRTAQAAAIEGRDGPDLRTALRGLRAATTALGRQAGDVLRGVGRAADTAEVVARLGEIAAEAAAVEQLRVGVLGSADLDEEDLFTGLVPASSGPNPTAEPAPRQRAAKSGKAADADAAAARADERAARAAAREAERAAQAAAKARAAERAELEHAVATASAARDSAAANLATAEAALTDATAALERFDATN